MNRNRLTLFGVLAALIVLGADQASKWWVLDYLHLSTQRPKEINQYFNLTLVWNPGVTFGLLNGLGQWSHFILAAIAMAVVAALCVWLRRSESALVALSIGAIAGGAVGNVIDRLRFGAVVDFLHAHVDTIWGDLSWYVFNVADAAIVCGVVILAIDSQWPRAPKSPP